MSAALINNINITAELGKATESLVAQKELAIEIAIKGRLGHLPPLDELAERLTWRPDRRMFWLDGDPLIEFGLPETTPQGGFKLSIAQKVRTFS